MRGRGGALVRGHGGALVRGRGGGLGEGTWRVAGEGTWPRKHGEEDLVRGHGGGRPGEGNLVRGTYRGVLLAEPGEGTWWSDLVRGSKAEAIVLVTQTESRTRHPTEPHSRV